VPAAAPRGAAAAPAGWPGARGGGEAPDGPWTARQPVDKFVEKCRKLIWNNGSGRPRILPKSRAEKFFFMIFKALHGGLVNGRGCRWRARGALDNCGNLAKDELA